MTVIKTNNLTKTYTRYAKKEGLWGSVTSLFRREMIAHTAVNAFNLEIQGGEFVGLIGPNGAGKTTLIKMLTGIIAPSSGTISVFGYTPNRLQNSYKRQYAVVMGQKSQLFFDLTPADTFLLLKEIYSISHENYRRNLDYLTQLFAVSQFLNVQVRTLSLGERMKMELVAALLHNPKVLFLDEPTIGLDAVAQRQIRSFLKEVNRERGTTIILTSHYMEDIKSLCSRCVVINGGSKVYDGALGTLFERYQTNKLIRVTFDQATDYIPPHPVQILERNPHRLAFMAHKRDVRAILKGIMGQCEINDIAIEEEDIGNVVERIYANGIGSDQGPIREEEL